MNTLAFFHVVLLSQLWCIRATAADDWDKKFPILCNWIKENGGKLGNVRPKMFKYGKLQVRGLAATHDMEGSRRFGATLQEVVDHVGLDIPNNLTISETSDFIEEFKADMGIPLGSNAVPLWMAVQRRRILNDDKTSFWAPYIDVLPTAEDLQFHPMYASQKELEPFTRFFKNDPAGKHFSDGATTRKEWDREGELVAKKVEQIFGVPGLTFEDYLWGVVIVTSRSFTTVVRQTPFMDLFNHASPGRNHAAVIGDQGSRYFVGLEKRVAKGQEITITYRDVNSLQLFLTYGFVDWQNEKTLTRQSKKKCGKFLAGYDMSAQAVESSSTPAVVQSLQTLVREACPSDDVQDFDL